MSADSLRVMIVDDSRIFRGVIEESLAARGDVKVIGSVWNGEKALELARHSLPDFVTLDIEMPGLGGLETLKALRELSIARQHPIGVLLISSYTKRGARVTIEGLHEGAFDFIAKPDSADPQANAALLGRQLFEKLDAFRSSRVRQAPPIVVEVPSSRMAPAARRPSRFRAVVIGASTGGPEALTRLLPVLTPACPVPMYLVQHLPVDFTDYFATSLSRRCGIRVIEAQDGGIAQARELHVAPGGKHLVLHGGVSVTTRFSDAPPENGCRPAADVLFRSAAAAYAGNVLAVVLTGMGCDGAQGSAALKRAGAHVIVQDEATSVVWGMPGSTVAAGAADQVLPIDKIAAALLSRLGIGE